MPSRLFQLSKLPTLPGYIRQSIKEVHQRRVTATERLPWYCLATAQTLTVQRHRSQWFPLCLNAIAIAPCHPSSYINESHYSSQVNKNSFRVTETTAVQEKVQQGGRIIPTAKSISRLPSSFCKYIYMLPSLSGPTHYQLLLEITIENNWKMCIITLQLRILVYVLATREKVRSHDGENQFHFRSLSSSKNTHTCTYMPYKCHCVYNRTSFHWRESSIPFPIRFSLSLFLHIPSN